MQANCNLEFCSNSGDGNGFLNGYLNHDSIAGNGNGIGYVSTAVLKNYDTECQLLLSCLKCLCNAKHGLIMEPRWPPIDLAF